MNERQAEQKIRMLRERLNDSIGKMGLRLNGNGHHRKHESIKEMELLIVLIKKLTELLGLEFSIWNLLIITDVVIIIGCNSSKHNLEKVSLDFDQEYRLMEIISELQNFLENKRNERMNKTPRVGPR